MEYLNLKNWEELAKVVKYLREAISAKKDTTPVGELLNIGLTGHILYLLNQEFSKESKLQIETAWLLANMTAGTTQNIDTLIEFGCLSVFMKCFNLPNEEVHENVSIFKPK